MDQYRHDLLVVLVFAAHLAGLDRAQHHRIDDFEVGRVERQGHVDRSARSADIRGEAKVVLDVARPQRIIVLAVALELLEQHCRRLTENVDQNVQAPAMRHAQDHFLHTLAASVQNGLVQQRDQAVPALQ